MTANRFPHNGPPGGRLDLRGHGPIRPGSGLPLNAVNHCCQFAKGGLINLPLAVTPRQVVQLRDAVRRRQIRLRGMTHTVSAVGSRYCRGGGDLGYGNVVRVTVRSLRTEGHYDMWLNAPNLRDDGANRSCGIDLIKGAVREIENGDFANS